MPARTGSEPVAPTAATKNQTTVERAGERELVIQRTFNAPARIVFDAWTKADLVRIVEEQRGSDVTQAFVIKSMTVDPKGLTSEVKGTLKTFVGAQVIASDDRRFRFTWTYRGLRLALAGFAQLPTDDKPKESQ